MAFSSAAFVFVFLPVVFVLYYLIPWHKGKNLFLLIASLLFYSAGSLPHLPLLVGAALLNYLAGLWFRRKLPAKRVILAIDVILSLAILAAFKYLDFFTQTFNDVTGLSLALPGLALPIGISFFTFQALSYAIDVYREPESGTKSFFELLLYISFFPQLIAGPIVKYHDVALQIKQRTTTLKDAAQGCRRFLVGLGKKLLLADIYALAVDAIFGQSLYMDARLAWLAAICYCLQIYFDFSAYSDMAIGMGRMFGFRFLENFDLPYRATTIQEFWRRWHISLSSWFREYVYIPLGGNRKGTFRTCLNVAIVFFLTGLWHGASWTFVLWGIWHGFWSILERVTPLKKLSGRVLGHIYALLVVLIGFVLFRADTIPQAAGIVGNLFSGFSFSHGATLLLRGTFTAKLAVALVIGILLSAGLQKPALKRLEGKRWSEALSYVAVLVMFAVCILRLATASFNPFIYFQF